MIAYYNEHDPFAAQWLHNLADSGLIAPGRIDGRDIQEVEADDIEDAQQVHLFAGIGGWSLALQLAGWPADAPVWTLSCPCQPFSCAGSGMGEDDARHLWPEARRLIAECRPSICFGEQVASADGRKWLAGVRSDLEALGYAVGAADLCAAGEGAPHIRQRLYWVADAQDADWRRQSKGRSQPHAQTGRRGAAYGIPDSASGGQRIDGSTSRDTGHADECGTVDGLGDAASSQSRRRKQRLRPGDRRSDGDSRDEERAENGRLGDASDAGLSTPEQRELPGPQRHNEGRAACESGSAWGSAIVIDCQDGKRRRIDFESSVFPLAYGIPRVVGPGFAGLDRVGIRAARTNRTGRLRGYGNAIVPQVAAKFIRAYMEETECSF